MWSIDQRWELQLEILVILNQNMELPVELYQCQYIFTDVKLKHKLLEKLKSWQDCMSKNLALKWSCKICTRKDLARILHKILQVQKLIALIARKRARLARTFCMHRCKVSARLERTLIFGGRPSLQDKFCWVHAMHAASWNDLAST